MPDTSHRFLDERLAKALSHRLRVQILQHLDEVGEASPKELAQALGEPVGNVSYHVRILRDLDCVELVRTQPRRGSLAHFYRATVSPWLDAEQWAQLPAAHVRRVVVTVDADGLTQIDALLDETLEAVRRIAAEGTRDRSEPGHPSRMLATEVAVMHLPHE